METFFSSYAHNHFGCSIHAIAPVAVTKYDKRARIVQRTYATEKPNRNNRLVSLHKS